MKNAIPAIPPLRYDEKNRRSSICRCGQEIMTSGFGWVHKANVWVRLGQCDSAKPKASA